MVEAYRDEQGRAKQRTVAILGRLDQPGSELESVIAGLLRMTAKALPETPSVTRSLTRWSKKPRHVVKRYKSLDDIERGFRVLKSEIGIRPI